MCISIENRSSNFTATAIKNAKLRSYANALAKDAMNIRANLLHMSAVMAAIAAQPEILEEFDGSVVKFAESRLGIRKSQCYSMIQVGATFLDDSGKVLLSSAKGSRWNNTQLMALLPMGGTGKSKRSAQDTRDAVSKLIADGKISSDMTVAAIKDVVATERPDAKAKAKAKAERKAKADAKAKAESKSQDSKAKVIEPENSKVNGTRIAAIEFRQLDDGSIVVYWDGEDRTFGNENIQQLVTLMQGATNYKA